MLYMSPEMKKESVKTGKKLCEAAYEERLQQDIALPDYCADIKKILRCSVIPGIHTVSLSGEKATAKGTGIIRVLYLAEGDKADAFEKSFDLTSGVSLKDVPADGAVTARATVDFVNCRATSQRKLSISAGVTTVFSCFGGVGEEYAVRGELEVETKTESLTAENYLGCFEKTFDMNETVVLNTEHKPIGKIACCTYRCEPGQSKLSSGKLLVRGELVTEVCYICDGGDGGIDTLTHKMPVSQIIDVRDMPDSAACKVQLKVNQLLCTVKADSSGSNRMLEISARVSAFAEATEKKEIEVITDCYCRDYETEESFETPALRCHLREIVEGCQARGEVELPTAAKEICFAKCLDVTQNVKFSADGARGDCSALVMLVYKDESGIPCCCEKNIDFDFSYSIAKKCDDAYGSFVIEPMSVSAALNGSGRAEIVLDYNISGKIFCSFDKRVLKALTVCKDKPKKEKGAALTLYFAQSGERLWDIAREHNTTVDIIMQENGLNRDFVEENSMLMISCL